MLEAGKIRLETRSWFAMDQGLDASLVQAGSQQQKKVTSSLFFAPRTHRQKLGGE